MSVPSGKIGNIGSNAVNLKIESISAIIQTMIADAAKLQVVSLGDLKVYSKVGGASPTDVADAIRSGTRFFDALYYFALGQNQTVTLLAPEESRPKDEEAMTIAKDNLLRMYLYIMIRGSYPKSEGLVIGTDVPAFLKSIVGMDISPLAVSQSLASFPIEKVPIGWVRLIKVGGMAQAIKQRLALGLPGYRMFGPFRFYPCRADATAEAKAAYDWVVEIVRKPLDWALFSPTRSPEIIAKLGSLNMSLSNLMLECFTDEQITEMMKPTVKIIFKKPVYDPRGNGWKNWTADGPLELKDPINLLSL